MYISLRGVGRGALRGVQKNYAAPPPQKKQKKRREGRRRERERRKRKKKNQKGKGDRVYSPLQVGTRKCTSQPTLHFTISILLEE